MTDQTAKRLTQLSSKAGCASKMSPKDLSQVLCQLDKASPESDPNVLVGFDLMDDAGVYKLSDDLALVQTVDFFTPIVDDPYIFGRIAAANAFSDIYAMGGKPLTALSIACFSTSVGPEILAQILKGGESIIKEAGAVLLGGHTVTDEEIKYGLSVTGTVHPNRVTTNAGARPGDLLVLTKPLGTGILTTGHKYNLINEKELDEAVLSMSTLNKWASEAIQSMEITGCTDVTGFGLLGHSLEMAKASHVKIQIDFDRLPFLNLLPQLIEKEAVPGGAYANRSFCSKEVSFGEAIDEAKQLMVSDPQTSGGLLIAVSPDKAETLVSRINEKQPPWARIIGRVLEKAGEDDPSVEIL